LHSSFVETNGYTLACYRTGEEALNGRYQEPLQAG
jgi:hypothetical protein